MVVRSSPRPEPSVQDLLAHAAELDIVRPSANRHGSRQRGAAAARSNHPFEDNTMASGQPEDADTIDRQPRQRRIRIIVGLFMLLLGVPPLLNDLGNPRVRSLHGVDALGLVAWEWSWDSAWGCS
jgi:hypothetical protein